MKNKILSLFALSIIATIGFSQGIEEVKVSFKSERLPLKPLGSAIDGYYFKVETPYAKNNNELIENAKQKHENDVANYPNTVSDAELKFEQDMAQYDKDVITAQENFKLESEEYDKKSALEKIALKDKGPTLKSPRKPVYYKPQEPRYVAPPTSDIITFDPEVLVGSYIKLDGYNKVNNGKVLTGLIILSDFELEAPDRQFEEKNVYNSTTKATQVQKVYYYITKYNRPVYLKLQNGNEVLFEGIVPSTTEKTVLRSEASPNVKTLEKASVESSLILVNDFINSLHGYSQIERNLIVQSVKNKNGVYDDLENAKNLALTAYRNLDGGKNTEDLKKAVVIWEQVLKESDLVGKKARINEKVTGIVLTNLIDAHLILQNPVAAETHMKLLESIKVPYKTTLLIPELKESIRDAKERVAAIK